MNFFYRNFKKISFNILFSIFLLFIIYLLFNYGFIKDYLVGGPSDDFFIDLKYNYIHWLECHKFQIYHENCILMDYGKIFYSIPFNEKLKEFYINYIPSITIFIFVFAITFLLNPKNKIEYLILTLATLNPTTLVLIERLNFDIYVFLLLIIVAINRVFIFNWLLIFYCFLVKLYPVVAGSFIFIEDKRRSIKYLTILIIIFTIPVFYFLIIDYFNISKMFVSGGKPGYFHIFGLNTVPKILKYLGLNYIFSMIFIYVLFVLLLNKFYNYISTSNLIDEEDFFTSKWRLFIIGGNILFFCFVFYTNYTHREIFLVLLIPQLLLIFEKNDKLKNILINFLVIRYIFLFFYGVGNVVEPTYHIDGIRHFSMFFLLTTFGKGLLDFILISFVGAIIIKINFKILKKFFLSFKT